MLKANFNLNLDPDIQKASKKLGRALKKTLWFLGERAFVSFIVFVFLAILVGGAIFYYYNFLVAARESEVTIKNVQLNEDFYQSFLKNYNQRKEAFFRADSKIYFNPFYQEQERSAH